MSDAAHAQSQGTIVPSARAPQPIDPNITIGHVHLRTADIDRVRAFYVEVLGFDVVLEARGVPGWGTTGDILFLAAGGYHHHLDFNTWKSAGGAPQPDGVAGLHHVARIAARTFPEPIEGEEAHLKLQPVEASEGLEKADIASRRPAVVRPADRGERRVGRDRQAAGMEKGELLHAAQCTSMPARRPRASSALKAAALKYA